MSPSLTSVLSKNWRFWKRFLDVFMFTIEFYLSGKSTTTTSSILPHLPPLSTSHFYLPYPPPPSTTDCPPSSFHNFPCIIIFQMRSPRCTLSLNFPPQIEHLYGLSPLAIWLCVSMNHWSYHEFHETCHSITFIVLVNSHQRWKQMRNCVCFHLRYELTLAWCHSIV